MCTEFFLAITYFIVIFFVNYFLFKLLKVYLNTIFCLLRIRNIFKFFKKLNTTLVYLLSSFLKKEKTNSILLANLHRSSTTKDILIIGNTYKYLSTNLNYKNSEENKVYYFELLATHYLPTKKKKIP